jgi:hypothetical protein
MIRSTPRLSFPFCPDILIGWLTGKVAFFEVRTYLIAGASLACWTIVDFMGDSISS